MSALSDLQGCQSTIDSAWSIVAAPLLAATIGSALGVPAPDGSPAAIRAQGGAYLRAGATCGQVAECLDDVARNRLPAAWRGDVAETASQAVSALSDDGMTARNVRPGRKGAAGLGGHPRCGAARRQFRTRHPPVGEKPPGASRRPAVELDQVRRPSR